MSRRTYSTDKKLQESSPLGSTRWEDLNPDILNKIFSLLPSSDLFLKVSLVCHKWQLCCWHTLFWGIRGTLDLGLVLPSFSSTLYSDQYLGPQEDCNRMAKKLMKRLKSIMEGNDAYGYPLESWRLSIREISIPCDVNIADEHLLYLAQSTPRLETLVLAGSKKITQSGFGKAMGSWQNVKHINLIGVFMIVYHRIIEEIGKCCSKLETLSITNVFFHLGVDIASDIARSFPKLKTLILKIVSLSWDAVTIIYKSCLELEAIFCYSCSLRKKLPEELSGRFSDNRCSTLTLRFTGKKWDRQWCLDS